MNAITTLSSKGQLVVPKSIRDRRGWKAGDQIELVESGAGVILRAVPAAPSGKMAEEIFAAIHAMVAEACIQPIDDETAAAAAAESLLEADLRTRS